jgi:hypothetical protein
MNPPFNEILTDDRKFVSRGWIAWFTSITGGGKITQPTVGSSPFTYQNTTNLRQQIVLTGGTVSAVQFSRDNSNFYTLTATSGVPVTLLSKDFLKITHTGAPTMTVIPI